MDHHLIDTAAGKWNCECGELCKDRVEYYAHVKSVYVPKPIVESKHYPKPNPKNLPENLRAPK